jgi:hypothetical protein
VWTAGHITLAGWPCVGAFPKTILSTCPAEVVLKVSIAHRRCKEETWLPGQFAWLAGLTSGPHVPNLRPEHCLTPPVNTTVLLLAESVKKVRFSSPQAASKFNLRRVERGEVLRAGGLPGLSRVLRVARAWKLSRNLFGLDGVDEDINTSATIIPSVEIVNPITRSRAQQLNHQVNSFLCSSTYNIES